VEISSKWEHLTGVYNDTSRAEIDLDGEGTLEITASDLLLSMRNPRAGGRMYLTHVHAREAAVLLLEAVDMYRDSNNLDVDEGIAAALAALAALGALAPGAVTA
jgi:hypothetical protein